MNEIETMMCHLGCEGETLSVVELRLKFRDVSDAEFREAFDKLIVQMGSDVVVSSNENYWNRIWCLTF